MSLEDRMRNKIERKDADASRRFLEVVAAISFFAGAAAVVEGEARATGGGAIAAGSLVALAILVVARRSGHPSGSRET